MFDLHWLYEKLLSQSDAEEANALVWYRHWYRHLSEIDLRTGEPTPTSLQVIFDRLRDTQPSTSSVPKDPFFQIIEFVGIKTSYNLQPALLQLLPEPKTKIQREHTFKHPSKCLEIDSRCIQWLSQQPGYNIRGKLAHAKKMMTVQRRMSRNTLENQLLKEFVRQCIYWMSVREKCYPEIRGAQEGALHQKMRRWLYEPDNDEIQHWRHLPPNNTLLQHKHYHRIWKGWQKLQQMDIILERDVKNLSIFSVRQHFIQFFMALQQKEVFIADQPIQFDFAEGSFYQFAADKVIISGYIPQYENQSSLSFQGILDNDNPTSWRLVTPDVIHTIVVHSDSKSCQLHSYDRTEESTRDHTISTLTDLINHIFEARLNQSSSDTTTFSTDLNTVVLDIHNIQPKYYDSSLQIEQEIPTRICSQRWKKDDKFFLLNTQNSTGITFISSQSNLTIDTFTPMDVFSSESLPTMRRNDSANLLVQNLFHYFSSTAEFCYLSPDIVDDFTMEPLRRSLNGTNRQISSLPRSIACILDYQYSHNNKIQPNDVYFVVDLLFNKIVITPLKAKHLKALQTALPQSEGIYWERYGSIQLDGQTIKSKLIHLLEKQNIPHADMLIEKFGCEWLLSDNPFAWRDNGKWYHLSKKEKQRLTNLLINHTFKIGKFEHLLPKDFHNKGILLPIQNKVSVKPETSRTVLNPEIRLLRGGHHCATLSKKIHSNKRALSLWKDHLPKLSIKVLSDTGVQEVLLVDDSRNLTITPILGEVTPISIKQDAFRLPKGKENYIFPLYQGDGSSKLYYTAVIQSKKHLPLTEDVSCRLKLTYTYGQNNPYSLTFVANDHDAPFEQLPVQWEEDTNPHRPDIFPAYPSTPDWNELYRYPDKHGRGHNNLVKKLDTFSKQYGTPSWNDQKQSGYLMFLLSVCLGQGRRMENAPADIREPLQTLFNKFYQEFQHKSNQEINRVIVRLSRFHQDTPAQVFDKLLNSSDVKMLTHALTSVLGDLTLEKQQQLLLKLFSNQFNKPQRINILNEAAWRNSNFIPNLHKQITPRDVSQILQKINKDMRKITQYNVLHLYDCCTLLLALLRMREYKKPEIVELLSPKNIDIQKIIDGIRNLNTHLWNLRQKYDNAIASFDNQYPKFHQLKVERKNLDEYLRQHNNPMTKKVSDYKTVQHRLKKTRTELNKHHNNSKLSSIFEQLKRQQEQLLRYPVVQKYKRRGAVNHELKEFELKMEKHLTKHLSKQEQYALKALERSWISFDTSEISQELSLSKLDPLLFALQAYLLGNDIAKLVRISEISSKD